MGSKSDMFVNKKLHPLQGWESFFPSFLQEWIPYGDIVLEGLSDIELSKKISYIRWDSIQSDTFINNR